MPRVQTKAAIIKLRLDPQVKGLITATFDADGRSLSNTLEVIMLGYCKQHGIVAEKPQLASKSLVVTKKKRVLA